MDSDEEWIVLNSDNPADSSDDDRVLALTSSCTTPECSDDDGEAEDDAEGLYDPEDLVVDPLRPPPPKPLAGLFHNTPSRAAAYAPFDALRSAKQLIPDPAFTVFPEGITVLASTRGLVCLRGNSSGFYYVANPATFKRARLPLPDREHGLHGDPAVVITFDEPRVDDHNFDHYHVVVAFPVGDGIFAFESFSSRTWEWRVGADICPAEQVVSASGVGALGYAFWRTTIGYILCFNPETGCTEFFPAPPEVETRPVWEIGEMEGNLCVTCMAEGVHEVAVLYLVPGNRAGEFSWSWAGQFDRGAMKNRHAVTLLRSQGAAEAVMWDPQAELVLAIDLEGRTTRTIGPLRRGMYNADFIPYVSMTTEIYSDEVGNEFKTTDAVAYKVAKPSRKAY